MSSGRRFLDSLDRGVDQLRRDFRELDTELQGITRGLAAVRRRETDVYRGLARLRLDAIDGEALTGGLDAADREAQRLLGERETALERLGDELDRLQSELERLAAERGTRADTLATAEQALTDRLADVQATLAADAEFAALRERSQSLVDQAAHADEKTARAEHDRRDKGKPYEADPLFQYLWERGYGTSRYSAWPPARLIDRMLARHIRYEHARRNYFTLTEIPRRLRRHTERLETEAASLLEKLAERERAAELAAGVEALEAAVTSAGADVEATDQAIETAETDYREALTERERFANGTDPFFEQALAALMEGFEADPIPALRRDAESTPDSSDDRLVRELGELRREAEELSAYLDDKQEVHGRRMARLRELTAVRSQYKRKRYDAVDSVVDDRGNAELMLTEFLKGLVSSDRLWRVIRHSQRFRPRVGRARSGNLGGVRLPRMPRSVRIPRGMGGSGGFKVPRMPGGGGFRTKGGF